MLLKLMIGGFVRSKPYQPSWREAEGRFRKAQA